MDKVKRKRLGELLVEEGMLSEEQLTKALEMQKESGKKLGEILVSAGFIKQEYIIRILEMKMDIPYVKPDSSNIDVEALKLITEDIAKKYEAIPIRLQKGKLVVAMSDPLNIHAIDDLSIITGMAITPAIATTDEIRGAITIFYSEQTAMKAAEEYKREIDKGKKPVKEEQDEINEDDLDNSPIVKMLDLVIEQAIRTKASDVHIEPTKESFRVRLRQDGQMVEIMKQDSNIYPAFSTRIKIIAGMNIAEKRKPQDGRISTQIDGTPYDIRVSSLPTVFGEKIVFRIINASDLIRPKSAIIKYPEDLARYDEILKNSYGIILITGPTGSGKSTTLYTTVSELNRADVNIISVEDPVEAVIEGINQVHVNHKAGMDFSSALRSILRQDPDIIVVGEIRDSETAQISVRAAVTGHLVISTLHTNDAPGTITRLLDMGIEQFLISISLVGVVAQRLVKLICPNCKEAYTPADSEWEMLGVEPEERPKELYRGKGCANCNNTGYRGRAGVYEIMNITTAMRNLINQGANADEIRQQAVEDGMSTLKVGCVRMVLDGKTTVAELIRVAYSGN